MSFEVRESQNSFVANVKVKRTFEYIVIREGIALYRDSVDFEAAQGMVPKPLKGHANAKRSSQGFTTEKNAVAFAAGKVLHIDGMKDPKGQWVLLSRVMLDAYTSHAWNAYDVPAYVKEEKRVDGYGGVFDQFKADPTLLPVQVDGSSHMVYDADGLVEPIAMHYDYISAQMNNGNYDLPKVLDKLKNDSRIRFNNPDRYREKNAAAVHAVPYYNNSSGCREFLDFYYVPTKDEANAMWQKQLSYKTRYPSTERYRAVRDLDLLGIEAFRLPERDYSVDESDDD